MVEKAEIENKLARGQRIRDAIARSGKSHGEIAQKLQVRSQAVSKWGQTGAIQADNLWMLAEFLEEDIQYLLFGESTPNQELHQLVKQLTPEQAKQVTLFVNTLRGCDDANMEFSLVFSQKTAE